MKKKTIKELENDLALFAKQAVEASAQARKAETELGMMEESQKNKYLNELTQADKNQRTMFEIIRWLANPETAKDPFNNIERERKNIPPQRF